MQSVGVILDEQKKYDEAEKTYREALAIQRKVLGALHPDIVTTLTNLANTLSHAGKLATAAGVYREALTMSEKVYGRQTTDTAHVLAGLAELELRQGRRPEAEALARESLATREKFLGAAHQAWRNRWASWAACCWLGATTRKRGRRCSAPRGCSASRMCRSRDVPTCGTRSSSSRRCSIRNRPC